MITEFERQFKQILFVLLGFEKVELVLFIFKQP